MQRRTRACSIVRSAKSGLLLLCCGLVFVACSASVGPAPAGSDDAAAVADNLSADGDPPSDAGQSGEDGDDGRDVGDGCLGGCPCVSDAECGNGVCADGPSGRRCAAACPTSCPTGSTCQAQPGGAANVTYCLPTWGRLCRPCRSNADCALVAGARCVELGHAGAFCGSSCSGDESCPSSHRCADVVDVNGAATTQCVPKGPAPESLGVCGCSPGAIAAFAGTRCQASVSGSPARLCTGDRHCGADGLTPCKAWAGPQSTCIHAACDGEAAGTGCDDGDSCTTGETCSDGVCGAATSTCACQTSADCVAQDDGDPCNGTLYCDTSGAEPTCKVNPATVVVCATASDGPCTQTACQPKTAACEVVPLPKGATCSDGAPCTVLDGCDGAGQCVGGASQCSCKSDLDCAAKDDGDPCNGVLYCAQIGAARSCEVKPGSVVTCAAGTSADGCQVNSCVPSTGACAMVPVKPGTPCDDGSPCTSGDQCQGGACTPGTFICQCKGDKDCAPLEDGDLCNGTLFCDLAVATCKLKPSTVVTCDDGADTDCVKATCAPAKGTCAMKPLDGPDCDDGNVCTVKDRCQKGVCVPEANTCACSKDSDCLSKGGGDLCTGALYCHKAKGECRVNPATVVACTGAQNTQCLTNLCQSTTGKCALVLSPDGASCDADGTPCTAKDTCLDGACKPGPLTCDCLSDADCAAKDDGDSCNGTLYCDKTGPKPACVVNPATVKSCPSAADKPCVRNLCQPKTGTCAMTTLADGAPCDDGEPCTGPDACQKGGCSPGGNLCPCTTAAECVKFEDVNVCTTLACDATGACVQQGNTAPCDDGDACTELDQCAQSACQAGQPKSCDDANPCTTDSCDKAVGCQHAHVNVPCSDGSACTTGDSCTGGACMAGKPLDCHDGKPCTVDDCDKAAGCTHSPSPAGSPCPGGTCTQAVCLPTQSTATFVAIRAGADHTCAVRAGGGVDCWGYNHWAELGDGGRLSRSVAAPVKGLNNAVDVAVGWEHTCAAHKDGTVSCWGHDDLGQCGTGEVHPYRIHGSPKQIKGLTGIAQVAAGRQFSCALSGQGDVWCWGASALGQLGAGVFGAGSEALLPIQSATPKNVVAVDAGDTHACALTQSGSVYCWGDNSAGQLGDGTVLPKASPQLVPGVVGAVALAAGGSQSCALSSVGAVTCWGNQVSTPKPPPGPAFVATAVGVGVGFVCALDATGTVRCWGANDKGQLGLGHTNTASAPTPVKGLSGVSHLSVGYRHVCVLTQVGAKQAARCWGDNLRGQAGDGSRPATQAGHITYPAAKLAVPKLTAAASGSSGAIHWCLADVTGAVHCWGYNASGQLGDGTTANSYVPVQVKGVTQATAVSCASSHTCARQNNGTVQCWGSDAQGKLGGPGSGSQARPVTGLSDATALATGSSHTCALRANKTVACWGSNGVGQLGSGTKTNASAPVAVLNLAGVEALSAGGGVTCARKSDGTAWCWGSNTAGQLGNGTKQATLVPVQVKGATGIKSLAVGGGHGCAANGVDKTWCWGVNSSGQLGIGTSGYKTNSTVPLVVPTLSGNVTLSLGATHSCALLASGKVLCWGSNQSGQVGNGAVDWTTQDVRITQPTEATGVTGALTVSAGAYHTCVERAGGELMCWGADKYGQQADGVPWLVAPTLVKGLQ